MIQGTVNSARELILHLLVQDAAGKSHPIEVVVDTGFNGSLTLPQALIAEVR